MAYQLIRIRLDEEDFINVGKTSRDFRLLEIRQQVIENKYPGISKFEISSSVSGNISNILGKAKSMMDNKHHSYKNIIKWLSKKPRQREIDCISIFGDYKALRYLTDNKLNISRINLKYGDRMLSLNEIKYYHEVNGVELRDYNMDTAIIERQRNIINYLKEIGLEPSYEFYMKAMDTDDIDLIKFLLEIDLFPKRFIPKLMDMHPEIFS